MALLFYKHDCMGRLVVFFMLLFVGSFLYGNSYEFNPEKKLSRYVIENWTNADGLPSNSLLNIIQTSDGYIWVSSYNGLIRFDGLSFTIFNNSNTDVFDANGIGALAEDSKGVLWMTTQNSGLISYENKKFKTHKVKDKIESLHRVIFIDSEDRIWSCSINGQLFYYQNDSYVYLKNINLPRDAIYSNIAQAPDEAIWIATEGKGIYRIKNNIVKNYTQYDGLASNWVSSLSFDEEDNLWIGTDRGVSVFKDGVFKTVPGIEKYTINKIIADRPNCIWFSSNSGLLRMNKLSGKFDVLTEENGLASNHTIDMVFGQENSLWLIHYKGGFSRIKNALFVTFTSNDNVKGSIVNTVCEVDSCDVLIGLNNGYINRIKDDEVSEFKPKKNIYGMRIRDIFKDSNGNLWIGTYSGLLQIKPNGVEKWYSPSNGFPAKYIRMIYEDRSHQIWVGTRHVGLINICQDGTYKIIDKTMGLNTNLIMSIDEDNNGNLVVGTSKGGIHFIKNNTVIEKFTIKDGLLSDVVFNTYIDNNNVLWIAVKGGLNWIKNGVLYGLSINKTVLPDSPFDILEDEGGNFWLPTSCGVVKINKNLILEYNAKKDSRVQYVLYGNQDGIKQLECASTSSSIISSDNHMWFPTIDGVIRVNPDEISINTYIPPVYIETVTADDVEFSDQKNAHFPAGVDRVVFNFTALSYYYPRHVFFQYRLNGYQEKWSEPDSKRNISYTNLPPGEYSFQVIACNNSGLWNTEGAIFNFTIEPFWYQTWWFKLLAVFSSLFLIYFILWLRVRQIKYRQIVLKKLVRERTAEIAEKNRKIQARNEEILQVTEEIQSQNEEIQSINDQLEKLSVVASETDNAIRIIQIDGKIEWVNKAFTKLYEYTLHEIILNDKSNLLSENNSNEAQVAINKCLKEKVTVIYTEQRKSKGGRLVWVQTTLSPILDRSNEIVKLVAIDTDVTKLIKAEAQIRRQNQELEKYRNELEETVDERMRELKVAKEKAEESDKLKTAFLTNMSHEIRTPMNAIVGFTDLISMGDLDQQDFNDYILKIYNSSEVLLHLIDDIVEVSRIEASRLEINKKEWVVNDILYELYDDYSNKVEGRSDVEFSLLPLENKDYVIFTDKLRIQQALKHLISNAFKYTEAGKVEMGCVLSGDVLQFFVKDTGIGIKGEDITVVFERFRKVEDRTIKLYRGAGLGLYIANSIVRALNGKIGVESVFGKGSIFNINFPIRVLSKSVDN